MRNTLSGSDRNQTIRRTCEMWGVVKWIDQYGRRIKLVSDEAVQWILLDLIIDVRA
ncbi:hypothetical protein [Brevibacillus reuszeri]|uniref:hypothetical protein n=1 Tax=Brevibacillus reuszeri TaxID=54915 RepID=UPI003D21599E